MGGLLPLVLTLAGVVTLLRARARRRRGPAPADAEFEQRQASAAETERRMAAYLAGRDAGRHGGQD
jgi:cytochrome c-type biogenesis protein CcmH/NrfF